MSDHTVSSSTLLERIRQRQVEAGVDRLDTDEKVSIAVCLMDAGQVSQPPMLDETGHQLLLPIYIEQAVTLLERPDLRMRLIELLGRVSA